MEVLQAVLALRSEHFAHLSSLSPNTIVAEEKGKLMNLDSLFKEVTVFKVLGRPKQLAAYHRGHARTRF